MNIAIVGGGSRCLRLIELIENHTFQEISPKVVAVADVDPDAVGFVKAREKGLSVTRDYSDFFNRDDIELIMELTGDARVFDDIRAKKKKAVMMIGRTAAAFFWEIARVSALQKETHEKLRETTASYDVIINELMHENVFIIGPDYRVLEANKAFLNDVNMTRKAVIGRHCYEVSRSMAHPCEGEDTLCPLSQAFDTQKPSQATHILEGSDNKAQYHAISCYPFFEKGDLVRAMFISKEITKDIEIQKAMMQQEKMASIGRLSAGIAHEVNNPLTTILTSSILIQEDFEPEDLLWQELMTISDEALRCRSIVSSLLDFARQTKQSKRLTDLNEIVKQSHMLTKKEAAFHDVNTELDLQENLPKTYVDRYQIQQALINLMLNAVQATDPGGTITLATRFDANMNRIEIFVNDTGIGIDPQDMDKIFDPFFTATEGGTGLGLAVTHGIVEQHGGTIHVESTLGRGTCFTIRLPNDSGQEDAE